MPLYNNMKSPSSFLGCPGVLNIGMTCVVLMYAGIGFLGYLKYGNETEPFITLNLPVTEKYVCKPLNFVKNSQKTNIFFPDWPNR